MTEKVIAKVGGSIGSAEQGLGNFGRADRVGDIGQSQTGNGDDVARLGLLDRTAVEAAECLQLGQSRLLDQAQPSRASDLTGMLSRATPE